MLRLDPIIAVKDIRLSSKWYQDIFGLIDKHGGDHFAILTDHNNNVVLCLHPWEQDGHSSMMDSEIQVGNGLILYFHTNELEILRDKCIELNVILIKDIYLNTNSSKMEFEIKDPDGFLILVTEYHQYED